MESVDTKTIKRCIARCCPQLSVVFDELVAFESLRLVGPFVLFAFLNDNVTCEEFPIHIQASTHEIDGVKGILRSLHADVTVSLNRHVQETKHNKLDTSMMIDGIDVFLFTCDDVENNTHTVIDLFGVAFSGARGFLGTQQLVASLKSKICRVDSHVARKLLPDMSSIETFFRRDCASLAKASIQVDWYMQSFWTFIWQFVIQTSSSSLFDFLSMWNHSAFEEQRKFDGMILIPRPLLLLSVALPYIDKQFTIRNSLFGVASFDIHDFQNMTHTVIPESIGMSTALSHMSSRRSTVIMQIGEWFSSQDQLSNFISNKDDKILLYDIYREMNLNKAVPMFQKKSAKCTLFMEEEDKEKNIISHLQSFPSEVVLFYKGPNARDQALCFDLSLVLEVASEYVYCWHHSDTSVGIKSNPSYWRMFIEASDDMSYVMITDDNYKALKKSSNRHFFLLKLNRSPVPMTLVNSDTCDESKLETVYAIVPVHLTNDSKQTLDMALKSAVHNFYQSIDRTYYSVGPVFNQTRTLHNVSEPKHLRREQQAAPQMRLPARVIQKTHRQQHQKVHEQFQKQPKQQTKMLKPKLREQPLILTPDLYLSASDDDTESEFENSDMENQIRREQRQDVFF